MYSVYLHTNKENGKMYCGITSMKPKKRWCNGNGYKFNSHFFNAIRKYKWENFEHDILYECSIKENAEQLEKFIINKLNLMNRTIGYNIREGGGVNSHHSQETREKLRKNHIGLKASTETKKKLSIMNKGENNSKALLTENDVLEIREIRYSCSVTSSEAYKMFKDKNITLNAFVDVWNYKNWTDIGKEYNTEQVRKWHKSNGKVNGENSNSAKLLNKEAENLKLEFICGASIDFLVNKYKITRGNVFKILRGNNYKYIRQDLNDKITYIQQNKFKLGQAICNLFNYGVNYNEIENILQIKRKTIINAIYKGRKELKIN
jgi:predicted GIY-YIG superfamily endonuclease